MKNKILIILLIFCSLFFINSIRVNALSKKGVDIYFDTEIRYYADDSETTGKDLTGCDILGADDTVTYKKNGKKHTVHTPRYYVKMALEVIKYLGIALCLILTVVDYVKALIGDEKEMYKTIAKKFSMRLVYAIFMFFIPTIVKFILRVVTGYVDCI